MATSKQEEISNVSMSLSFFLPAPPYPAPENLLVLSALSSGNASTRRFRANAARYNQPGIPAGVAIDGTRSMADTPDWYTLERFVEIRSPWLTLIGKKRQDEQQNRLDYWRVEKADSAGVRWYGSRNERRCDRCRH